MPLKCKQFYFTSFEGVKDIYSNIVNHDRNMVAISSNKTTIRNEEQGILWYRDIEHNWNVSSIVNIFFFYKPIDLNVLEHQMYRVSQKNRNRKMQQQKANWVDNKYLSAITNKSIINLFTHEIKCTFIILDWLTMKLL